MAQHVANAVQSALFFVAGVGAKSLYDWWMSAVMRRGG